MQDFLQRFGGDDYTDDDAYQHFNQLQGRPERLGQPGDPSYIAGSGGDGQSQQGNQQGSGTTNQALVPWTNVFQAFSDFAIDSLDRSYVPLDVKDYVKDYFSSFNQ